MTRGGHRDDVAAVVLAAGAGSRLRPLTRVRPKPLCPVANVPLVDHALERVAAVTDRVAVNVHHGRSLLEAHLAGRVHLSVEEEQPLGTAGALARLRGWIAGAPTLVVNGDTWCPADLGALLDGWDGTRIRLLVARPPAGGGLGRRPQVAGALLPWAEVERFAPVPSGLWEVSWSAAEREGRLEVVATDAPFFDCGTPASYLAANLFVSGGESVIGPGCVVDGVVERSVLWPGVVVRGNERLRLAVRAHEDVTVHLC